MTTQEIQPSPGTKPGFFYGYIIVVTSFIIMAIMWGTYHAFGVFFKPLIAEFGWTRAMTSAAFSISMIISGLSAIVMGKFTDKVGPRVVITLCGFLFGLGYLLISQVTTIWQLYLLYGLLIGIAMGGAWVPLMSTVARWFVARRSMMTGIVLAGLGVGGLIIPPLANQLISIYDWRMSYIIIGGAGLIIVILAAQFLKRDPTQMGIIPYGEGREAEKESNSGDEGFSLSEAIRTGQFWMFFGALLCFGFSLNSILVHIAPHATDLGTSESSAANMVAIIGGIGVVGMVVLGIIADKIGNRWVFIIGFALMLAALFALIPARSEWILYLLIAIFGFGHGGFATSESPLAARLFGLRSHGSILGTAVLGFSIGSSIGPVLTGYIFDVTHSYQTGFLVCAIMIIIGIILSALLRPLRG